MADLSPRQWGKGDPEPADQPKPKIRDFHGDVWDYNPADGLWYTPDTRPFAWEHLTRKWSPLTEVLPEKATQDDAPLIFRTEQNGQLEELPGVGEHKPRWYTVDCPSCGDGCYGGHPDILGCGECEEDWPCFVAQPVIDELTAAADLMQSEEDRDQLLSRAETLRGTVPPAQRPQGGSISSSVGGGDGEAVTDELRAVPYAEHERALREEIERRDEAEEWADKLAAALAPPHVVGEHSLKNHPWRNALEWAQRKQTDDESEWDYGYRHHGGRRVLGPVSEQWASQKKREINATVWRRRSAGEWEQVEQS